MRCSRKRAGDGSVAEPSAAPRRRTTAVSTATGPGRRAFTPGGSRRIDLLSSWPASVVAPGQQQSWPSSQLQSGCTGGAVAAGGDATERTASGVSRQLRIPADGRGKRAPAAMAGGGGPATLMPVGTNYTQVGAWCRSFRPRSPRRLRSTHAAGACHRAGVGHRDPIPSPASGSWGSVPYLNGGPAMHSPVPWIGLAAFAAMFLLPWLGTPAACWMGPAPSAAGPAARYAPTAPRRGPPATRVQPGRRPPSASRWYPCGRSRRPSRRGCASGSPAPTSPPCRAGDGRKRRGVWRRSTASRWRTTRISTAMAGLRMPRSGGGYGGLSRPTLSVSRVGPATSPR
jgi:hypothetical protein